MEKFDMLKGMKTEYFGNMSCVMQEMGAWKEDNSPNMEFFRTNLWAGMEEEMDVDFRNDLVMKYEMCEKFVMAMPEPEMPMAPFKKMFGKPIMFQNCILVRNHTIFNLRV